MSRATDEGGGGGGGSKGVFTIMRNFQKDNGSKDPPFIRKGDVSKILQPDTKRTVSFFYSRAPRYPEGSGEAARCVCGVAIRGMIRPAHRLTISFLLLL